MDSQISDELPCKEQSEDNLSVNDDNLEDERKNNNVYNKQKEDIVETSVSGDNLAAQDDQNNQNEDEENSNVINDAQSERSVDNEIVEESESCDALITDSSKSNVIMDRQPIQKDDETTSVQECSDASEVDSSAEETESEDKEDVIDNHQPATSSEVVSESNEDDEKLESESGEVSPQNPLNGECENLNEISVDKTKPIECTDPFEDAERFESCDDNQSSASDTSSHDDAVRSTESTSDLQEKNEKEMSGAASRAEKVAADRDRKNPAYIPRTGKFFMHDEREGEDITLEEFESSWFEKKRQEQEQLERKKGRIRYGFNGDRWGNDKFDERLQSPKTYEQIVSEYGYNIREDGQANRKKYWDGSYKYEREDNRDWKRRPRRNGNENTPRGRRSGGRGRLNQGPSNRSGQSNSQAANSYPDREPGPSNRQTENPYPDRELGQSNRQAANPLPDQEPGQSNKQAIRSYPDRESGESNRQAANSPYDHEPGQSNNQAVNSLPDREPGQSSKLTRSYPDREPGQSNRRVTNFLPDREPGQSSKLTRSYPDREPGQSSRRAANFHPDRELGQRRLEEMDPVGYDCVSTDRNAGNREATTSRCPQSNDAYFDGRGNRSKPAPPKYRREFKGKGERPAQKDRRTRNGQVQLSSDDKMQNPAAGPNSPLTMADNSFQNNASTSTACSTTPTVHVYTRNPPSASVPESSVMSQDMCNAKPSSSKSDEPKAANPSETIPSAPGYPSNKRYSAQRRERKFDRDVIPSNSRRQHQQSRQQLPNSNHAPHARDTHNHQKLHKTHQPRTPQMPPQSPDSQPQQQQQQPLPMSQLPQPALQADVGALPPPINYQSMHGGLEYPPHASVIPSMPQQELTYFGPAPTSVHPQYLLNYFRAIPADPNLQYYAQQQVAAAAAAAALANGQFPPNAPAAAPEAHFPGQESAGGAVFYSPLAQQQQQPPQVTPERPRRALPIVAPTAGSES